MFRHTASSAMLIFEGATVHIISQLIYQRATRIARFAVIKDCFAHRHPQVFSARKSPATFLTHTFPPDLFFGFLLLHSARHSRSCITNSGPTTRWILGS